ncbi:MAG: DUF5672 family protein [Candidatus Taylorbacteria bacterium]|nr:DUF5672 family protein [Candidatus Taylorbacteria bacterium]
MIKKKLNGVTLLGIDCVDIDRLVLVSEICRHAFDFEDVKLLTSLPSANSNAIPIKAIESVEDYSHFVISELDKYISTSHVLLIQYDGFILNPSAWSDEFLEYDYVGAPWLVADWSVDKFDFPKELLGKFVVGNGGFSLRSKRFLNICTQLTVEGAFKKYHPEDVALSVWNRELLESRGIRFAPVELAKRFSYEAEDDENNAWNGQFGFHGFRWTDISKWSVLHPEYDIDIKQNIIRLRHKK